MVSDWSADSEWLLASRENAVSNHSEIWELPTANNQAKGKARKIIACDPKTDLWQSRFSPDGHWIDHPRSCTGHKGIRIKSR